MENGSILKPEGRNVEMERLLERNWVDAFTVAVVVAVMAFAMVVIAFGMDSVAPGVHDALHDFRHALGMPCH